jgi:NADH:ubiquinone reductase (H+-translocating)
LLAVVGAGPTGVEMAGQIAELARDTLRRAFLIGFQHRLLVLIRWAFSFVTRGRGARLISEGVRH